MNRVNDFDKKIHVYFINVKKIVKCMLAYVNVRLTELVLLRVVRTKCFD